MEGGAHRSRIFTKLPGAFFAFCPSLRIRSRFLLWFFTHTPAHDRRRRGRFNHGLRRRRRGGQRACIWSLSGYGLVGFSSIAPLIVVVLVKTDAVR